MSTQETTSNGNTLALVYGSLLLRIWLGVRALQTGIEKFAGTKITNKAVSVEGADTGTEVLEATKFYSLDNYHGVPEVLMGKFKEEPLMPGFGLPVYDKLLGVALLGLGLTILLGLAYRSSLFVLGLLYISLTWGLILIKEDGGVAWLGTHMIMIVFALALAQYNRFAIVKKW
jgi:thiosulfate dehydrogenase (quinone) large subunit